jgi:uncharacterized Zn finger protein
VSGGLKDVKKITISCPKCGEKMEYVDASHYESSIHYLYGYFKCRKCGLIEEVVPR